MSIGKRFVSLLRSNLNSLLDRTADFEASRKVRLEKLSDDEIEAELVRRQSRRGAAERAADDARGQEREPAPQPSGRARVRGEESIEQEAWREVEEAMRNPGRYRTAGRRPPRTSQRYEQARRRPSTGGADLARLYAQLECPQGADLNTVRKHYRQMMRKYHPDLHSGSDDKQRLATELSQKLTQAYNDLRRALS